MILKILEVNSRTNFPETISHLLGVKLNLINRIFLMTRNAFQFPVACQISYPKSRRKPGIKEATWSQQPTTSPQTINCSLKTPLAGTQNQRDWTKRRSNTRRRSATTASNRSTWAPSGRTTTSSTRQTQKILTGFNSSSTNHDSKSCLRPQKMSPNFPLRYSSLSKIRI